MNIKIVKEPISVEEVRELAKEMYRDMVKGVADIEREIIALGGEWHVDANNILIADGSEQRSIWGFNLYPDKRGDDAVEYVSLINIRPAQGNREMEITDTGVRDNIRGILERVLPDLFV